MRPVLLLLLLASGLLEKANAARQNPLKDPKICGRPQCEKETNKFAYTDTQYKYDYTVRLRTEFSGTGENTSDLFLKSSIELLFPKPCEGFLRITDVKLWDNEEPKLKSNDISDESSDSEDYYGDFSGSSSGSNEFDLSGQHPKSFQLAESLRKFILRFAFHDGLISEVCPDSDEPAWVLNFKKGILSAFQNTMLRFDIDFNTTETDVLGVCKVHYTLESTADVFVKIRKVKDITSCRNRHSTHSILQTTPYTFRDDKTIWPILDSQSYCNMTIDNNIYREISCYERHQLIPFSNSSSGAVTTSRSLLQFIGEESFSSGEFWAQNVDLVQKRSTLLFDHTPSVKPTHSEIKASRELLRRMCAVGFPNIQREFIDIFTTFLQTTKSLDYKALNELLARSASICENGKNHVLESLPYIGSTASYQVMRDQIVSDAISRILAQSWMTTLSFVRFPDENTLETFYTILEFSRKKLDPEYTLGASAVIHSFCRHNEDCAENSKVKRIVNLLETEFLSLFNMYDDERRSLERMIVILKGLGNIGVISPDFAAELQEIIAIDGIAPIDIRLQAVETFRRVDCLKYRSFFLETYGNFTLNPEIRIVSYLQAMRCPDYKTIGLIKYMLETEEINQVGSFVWSHLKNLAKSSSPLRIEVQGLLLNDDLSDKFKLDIRKFSRNYEHSLFFDEYNFGTTTDFNLIFGTDSYLPRIASLNFTTDLFGQSVNFFEISARAEGFEELVSSFFGPKGPFNRDLFRKKLSILNKWLGNESFEDDDTLENFLSLDNLRSKRGAHVEDARDFDPNENEEDYNFEAEEVDAEGLNRKRRSTPIPAHIERKHNLKTNIDDMGYTLNCNYHNPRAQIAMRIFGNDLRYYTLEGVIEVIALFKALDPFERIAKIFSGKEFIYTKSSVFLDASYNVPLGIGLPLAIHAFGASSVDLRVSGNLERMEPTSDSWNFDVEGHFKPSISIDIITTMQSDLFYAASGIKVKSNLYSNLKVEAKLRVRGREQVSFSFDLPQDKNEIFSARSELLVMKGDIDLPQTGIERRQSNSSCTWPILDEAIGLKMCSYFSVPDLSHSSDNVYPGLLLSGPLNFSVVLTKSDLTAKKFAFEYQWEQENNNSDWSLVFHTPGSAIQRIFVMNVTTVPDAFKASVSFVNGRNRAKAGCNYNGDPEDRRLDLFLDNNGSRSLNLNMELKRSMERNTWVYQPKVLLTINGVNITGLVGVIRMTEKNGISQTDFDLSFETKKLQVLLRGNFVQNEVTTSTATTINYRFQANKIETINFDGRLINTGDRSKTEYKANVQLKSSAHPKLNFVSNGTWLSLQGHTEGLLTHNNEPNQNPLYTSHVRLVFARSYSEDLLWEGSRTRASFEVKVPRSKVDLRFLVKHEERVKNGTEHNVLIGFRYATDKEATGLFSIHFPRRSLFAMDAYVNVTIPEFNSCVVQLKLIEKTSQDYLINFNGSWFTGHSLGIRGNYKDRSSRIQSLHHLKLIVESPSFESTSLNIVYRRTQLLIFGSVQAKYGKNPYGLTVLYNSNADSKNKNAEIRLKIKEKDYWLNAKLLSDSPKLMQIEIHLDKYRDIHIKVGLISFEKRKELSLEFKWDANRDPAQRLGLLAEYHSPGDRKYMGNIMVTYPDRTVSCGFEVDSTGPKYSGNLRASWSISEIILFKYEIGIMPTRDVHNWLHAELLTPFLGWKRNTIAAGVYNRGNLFLANSSLLWADNQLLALGFKSDYKIADPILSFDVRFGVNSTIKDIPTVNVKIMHWQNFKKFDTDLGLHYTGANDSSNTYSLKSNWELINRFPFQNISGTMLMISPFEGYRKGGLAAMFSLSNERNFRGAASLNFDIREFTLAMDGYVRKYTDNMLTINITTPLEKFRTINGRFGLSEKKRHAVAEVRAPTAALGAEILCDIKTLMNFDVKLSVATPIEQFQQAALFAKIKPETIDLRGKWNNVTAGFTGVWTMQNMTNFEYSYVVFTPLPGFEENGFIVKFVKRDVFIMHVHGKLSNYKLGILINGHPKSKLLNQLGSNKIELEILYDEDFQPTEAEDYDIDDADYDEFFSYFVDFKVDTLVWPTIDGVIDIQEVMDFFLIVGNIQLPQGRLDIKDRLHYPDYLNVLNVLNVKTPFPMTKEIKSIAEYHIDMDFKFFYEKVHVFLNQKMPSAKEIGFEVNYTKVEDTLKPIQHNIQIALKTPFEMFEELDIIGHIEFEENIYRGNITSRTPDTHLSLAASVETEENFLETSIGILLDSKVVPYYGCNAYFKKDFSNVDNVIDIHFEVVDNDTSNKLEIGCDWNKNPSNIINANGRVKTTMLPLKLAETTILITKGANPALNFSLDLLSRSDYRLNFGTKASKKKDVFNVEIWTPIKNFRNISMHGSIHPSPSSSHEYRVSGQMYRNLVTYALNGIIQMSDKNYPSDAHLRFQPKSGGRDGVIEFSLNELENGQNGFDFQFSAIEDGKMCQISGGYSVSASTGIDFSAIVQSTEPDISRINFNGKVKTLGRGQILGEITLETPWKELGLEYVKLRSDLATRPDGGHVLAEYNISRNIGRGSGSWSWILEENAELVLESYIQGRSTKPRALHISTKYLNPKKNLQNLQVDGKINVDSKWNLDVNGKVNYQSNDEFQCTLITSLPIPIGDVHELNLNYRGNLIREQGQRPTFSIESRYQSTEAKRIFLSKLSYHNETNLEGLGHFEWGITGQTKVVKGDVQVLRKGKKRRDFSATLLTPEYGSEPTVYLHGNYDLTESSYHNVICSLDYPATRHIADMDIHFLSLTNMHGQLNSSTPFLNVTWFKTDFNFSTTGTESLRYCRGTWPADTAYFELHGNYASKNLDHNLEGKIEIEVPLATRHRADIAYSLQERPNRDDGHLKVLYNSKQVLNGIYKNVERHENTIYIDTTDITLENEFKPLGVHYTNKRDIDDPNVYKDVKHVEVFELRNVKNFNLTGELHTLSTPNGQDFKIVAIHPNRTLIFSTHYEDVDEHLVKQRSKLELSPTAWIGYNVELGNYTMIGNESHNFLFELSYPKRTLATRGRYYLVDNKFQSNVAFKWSMDNNLDNMKSIDTSLRWQGEPLKKGDRDHQTLLFTLNHPYLEKEVRVNGMFYRGVVELLKAQLAIDYSNDPKHKIFLRTILEDKFKKMGHTMYTFHFLARHPASELDVQLNSSALARPSYYKTESNGLYKRDYYPEKHGKFLVLLDTNKREIEYIRNTPYRSVRFWAIPNVHYPVYGVNATVWDTPETNNTGYFYVDMHRKLIRMDVNLTEDASQNLQMVGYIPDARSGFLDVWRNYEEIRIIDINSYLKMNHSRLITGRFHWRPKIKDDIKAKVKSFGNSLYNSLSDGIDFWIKTLYSESFEAMGVVWDKTKEYNKEFFNDIAQLGVLEDDLHDLRLFVNQSYDANDFYIKTVVNFTLTILDELAIRDHIRSLPKIFTEIWQSMGDSGKALRNSIVWLIEAIKKTYNNILEAVSRFFHGESLQYLSALMEKGIEKYDKFVKDLHISFIKYVENLWNKMWTIVSNYWKTVLKRLEPHVFKLISYIEETAWNLSKEIFDFIYKRTNEIAESLYFNKVSSFTQDVDRLYKDIKSNDAITNIRKYSLIAWKFIKEKYFKLVPFGAELNEVLTEILDEIRELEKIEQLQIFIQKYEELMTKLDWIAYELDIERRLHQLYALLRNKFRNYAMNALQTADMYREAKTKFVFDPEAGIIDLEQKLPMSWHAFNETPKFEEIPEYRMIARFQNVFSTTNSSIIRYIYNLRSHLDPKTWLPPYNSQALLIDSRHYMTFDHSFVGLNLQLGGTTDAQCSYLLVHDFFDCNFTLMLEPAQSPQSDSGSSRKLSFIANDQLIEMDLGNDKLIINGDSNPMLPLRIEDITIYRELDVLVIQSSNDYSLSCNVQFGLCVLEVGGWYFGKTAGLLGTMNNEKYDDYMKSNHMITKNVEDFTDSWSVQKCKQRRSDGKRVESSKLAESISNICHLFFKSGMLSACAGTIDVTPFYRMCLDLGANSNRIKPGHPANKGACTAALAYIEACTAAKIPLRVPDQCVFCQLANGSYVSEATFVDISGREVPRSTDVVFIVEAKLCNANLTQNKNLMTVVATLEEQFRENQIKNNRYAVVSFGGIAPFDRPRSVIYENRVFTSNLDELKRYFSHIVVGNGTNNDILQAISVASKLNFRPGVSKTFILISCSNCAAPSMRFDYTSILQYMLEEGVNLHILADVVFDFERTQKLRHFFGLDRDMVYSRRFMEGNAKARKQLHISRGNLGICTPLALETNGSVFSARKLLPDRKVKINPLQFATIFAKRVAKSAIPIANQTCECSGHNTGVAYMTCSPSAYPDDNSALDEYDLQFDDDQDWDNDFESEDFSS